MFNNTLSLPVTDDQPDEFVGKMRSRPRRKRRKSDFRGRTEFANRTCKQLTRWWPLVLFLTALLLLAFEASKIGWRSKTIKSEFEKPEKPKVVVSPVKNSESNLNRLDAPLLCSLYDLANCVPTLAKFYHQASESYEQSCARHISVVIYYQFERLFQFAKRIEDMMSTNAPEEIQFQVGLSKSDLRKVVKSNLSGVDKHITAMHKKLMKNMTSEELIPTLWDKCKKEFLDKYDSFVQLAAKVYPGENIPSVTEIRDLLASM